MLPKTGYKQPEKWLFPIDPNVDYRLPENRVYLLKAWVEVLSYTTEHNQQLRLMNHWIDTERNSDMEMKYWLAFLWGCCYNSIGPWTILSEFPTPPASEAEFERFTQWYNKNFDRMRFDTDCRYRKSKMLACVKSYITLLNGKTQEQFFEPLLEIADDSERFQVVWDTVMSISYYGRLSAWNFVEGIALVNNWAPGKDVDAQSFMLEDLSGSESNRNGICFLVNREDLLTKHGRLKSTGEPISRDACRYLSEEAEKIYSECVALFSHITKINRLNFETSGLCWFKKMFRDKNTRYSGWDSERTFDEIRYMEQEWPEVDVKPLYAARSHFLPSHLVCEQNGGSGVVKGKMGVFFHTGTPYDILATQGAFKWDLQTCKNTKTSSTKKLW